MSWKKVILVGVMAIVAVGLLGGCGNEKEKPTATAVKGKIVIGLDDNFPPYGFRDKDGKIVGFDIDMATEAAKRLGMTAEFKPIDWSAKEAELKSKKIDVIWNGLSITPDREKNILFSRPYMAGRQIILVRSDSPIQQKSDLAGKIVATQEGSTGLQAIQSEPEFQKSFKEFKQYGDNVTSFMDLEVGRIDAVVVAEVTALYFMQKEKANFRIVDGGYEPIPSGVGMSKDNADLKGQLDKVLEDMKKDGASGKIAEKWLGKDITL